MILIDTHCHLYDEDFDLDRDEIVAKALEKGIKKIFLPGLDLECLPKIDNCIAKYPDVCFQMVGMHPCYVQTHEPLEILEQMFSIQSPQNCIAVGEIGLDYHWDLTFKNAQKMAFRYQIDIALKYNKPIAIHSRNAMTDTIEILKEYNSKIKGVLHCFSGTYLEAEELTKLGFYLGIGGVVTYKKTDLVEVLSKINPKYIILETDSPYLPPTPYRGKRNEPSYLIEIATKVGDIWGVSIEEVAKVTTANAEMLFL